MVQRQTRRTRPPGETSGSAQRPAQRLAGPVLTFDLAAESERLRQERSYQAGDRNAKTLVKEPNVRIVLTAMKGGSRLVQHRAAGPVSVQTVTGHVRPARARRERRPAGRPPAGPRAGCAARCRGDRGERVPAHGRLAQGALRGVADMVLLAPLGAAGWCLGMLPVSPPDALLIRGSRTIAAAARLADSSQASGSAIRSGVRPVRT
ncbi:MAG: hypothetical protein KatS3mg060_2314 [Dehalococcoidia bacterium]|nr:MAG: hypothetical protein KatS3mg060_2314 [Dehalococcoidia bacterium]